VTAYSANANRTGGNNTFLGALSGPGTSTQLSNATAIGYNALVSASNALVLGGPNGSGYEVNVGIGTTTPGYTLDVVGTGNFSGAVTAASFTGEGSGLSNVNAISAATAAVATNALALGGVAPSGYATTGANTFGATQTISNGNLALPQTASASAGVINLGGGPFIHACCGATQYNTFVGSSAGNFTTTGAGNTASGQGALSANTTGYENTASGQGALYSNTTGYQNTASGRLALQYNTTGNSNTALGYSSGLNNSTGANNTFIGLLAGPDSGGLTNATAIGAGAVVSQSNSLILGGTGDSAVNVGIGTATPAATLDVVGSIQSSGSVTATSFVGPLTGIASDLECSGCVAEADLGFNPATQTELDAEATARATADTTLQTNISGKVSKAGDTMTGTLDLPANGLIVGASQLVASSGGVGIGASGAPAIQLRVRRTGTEDTTSYGLYVTNVTSQAAGSGSKHGAYVLNAGDVQTTSYGMIVTNSASNTTVDDIVKYGLSVSSYGTFTGSGGTPTRNYGLSVAPPEGADENYGAYIGGKVGIGTEYPKAQLQVENGDVYASTAGQGLIVRSPDGTKCARIGIDNAGTLAVVALACP